MTTEIFALCDAATVSGGKLNVLGAFDSIHAAQVPVVHAQCAIATRLRFMRIEEGQHRIRLSVVDEDGRAIVQNIDGMLTVNFGAEDESAVTNFIVNIHQLKLERLGQYSVDLAVDGRHEASLPLSVKAMPTPSALPPAEQ